MSSHAISTLRKRSPQRVGVFALVLSAMLALWLAVGGQLALAQAVPPPANANARSASTNEDTPVSIDTGILYDSRYQIVFLTPGPAHGTMVQNPAVGSGNPTPPTNFKIDYTPGANQTSAVSFSYQVCTLGTNPVVCGQSAVVTVSINPVNDGPQASPDAASVLFGESVLIPVLNNDNGGANESDVVSLVAGSVTAPTDAPGNVFTLNDGTAVIENNQIRYTAPTNAAAGVNCPVGPNAVTFNYQVQDGSGNQATGAVTVTVKCPGSPTLKLSEPHSHSGHTFKIDVILESADANVFATDFYLTYDVCLTDPDSPSDSKIADDVTSNLTAAGFLFDVVDDTFATRRLHFFAAAALNPNLVLAGPGNTTRTLATIQFKANGAGGAICTPTNLTLTGNGVGTNPGFTGANAAPLTGTGTPKTLALSNTNLNSKPTNLALNPVSVPENSPVNTYVGTFATTDPDAGDTHTVNFLAGVPPASYGSSSGRFGLRIVNNQTELFVNMQSATEIASGVYSVTLSTTDPYGGVYTKTFGINVTDVNKAPTANDDNNGNPAVGFTVPGFANIDVLANDTDGADFPAPVNAACPANGCSVVSVTNGTKGIVINQGTNVRYIVTDPKFNATDSLGGPFRDTFSYVMTDNDAPNALTASAKATVTVVAEVYPVGHALAGQVVKLGDCNGSGTVEAGDLTATGLEIFDGDGSLWYDIYKGTRTTFSPRGCNSNQDNGLDAGDISCTARKIFNAAATCGTVVAAGAGKATLEVASGLRGAAGSTVNVPVSLRNNGNAVDTAVFALAYDASKLSFNADDASAVSLSGGQLSLVNAGDGRVEIVVTGLSSADGAVATIRLTVKANASGDAAISLADSSLGSEGGSVAVDTAGGAIQIGGAGSVSFRSLLPLIRK